MGWFSKTPSSSKTEQARANLADAFKDAERASTERGAAFWEAYERRNGEGSVDWS